MVIGFLNFVPSVFEAGVALRWGMGMGEREREVEGGDTLC